jgi:hypothetical protein
MVQVYVVTPPLTVPVVDPALVQPETPEGTLSSQLTPPAVSVGATPAAPVTVAVKVKVEGITPPPDSVRTTVGVTFAIVTEVGAVAASAV